MLDGTAWIVAVGIVDQIMKIYKYLVKQWYDFSDPSHNLRIFIGRNEGVLSSGMF